jgi:hypothetical protein
LICHNHFKGVCQLSNAATKRPSSEEEKRPPDCGRGSVNLLLEKLLEGSFSQSGNGTDQMRASPFHLALE